MSLNLDDPMNSHSTPAPSSSKKMGETLTLGNYCCLKFYAALTLSSEAIKSGVRFHKEITTAWLKEIQEVKTEVRVLSHNL